LNELAFTVSISRYKKIQIAQEVKEKKRKERKQTPMYS
jgi:hypothetical protein